LKNAFCYTKKSDQNFVVLNSRAACRESNKEGVCPKLARDNQYAECSEDCQTDAECSGEQVNKTKSLNIIEHLENN
jgi:hypothetical protein